MKSFTVCMFVHHGAYYHHESATGDSVEAALFAVLQTSMGIGYGPKPHTVQFHEIASRLATDGSKAWGWADYTLTIEGA